MPVFEIQAGGKTYEVEAPDQQTAMRQLSAPQQPDKYQQAAQDQITKARAAGVPVDEGLTRLYAQGATFGGADELLAGLRTPLEMIGHGTANPIEGYRYAKAYENALLENARANQGKAGTAMEIAGGAGSAAGLGKAGLTFLKRGSGFFGNIGRGALEGAAYGGTIGALEGEGEGRLSGAAKGAGMGAAVGGAVPAVTQTVGAVAAPIWSNIRARINPGGVAASQVARAVDSTGRPFSDITKNVQRAATEGQPMYTMADEMGVPGQRLLRASVSSHGPGRAQAAEFLEQRQAGQGRRIVNFLDEGFGNPPPAATAKTALTTARNKAANVNYGAARTQAGTVDVSKAVDAIDNTLYPGVSGVASPQAGMRQTGIEQKLQRVRSMLTDGKSMTSDFNRAFLIKREIDDMINKGTPAEVSFLKPVQQALDDQLAATSAPYSGARDLYAQQSKAIEALDTGRQAQMRGRTDVTIPAFRGLPPEQQATFRAGYVDPLIEQTQGAALGANKARPFTSDAFQAEGPAFSIPGRGQTMMNQLGRENTMFGTRNTALGGSLTDMNLADQSAMRVDPGFLHSVATLNFPGMARSALSRVTDVTHGYTPAVRERMAQLLLEGGGSAGTAQREIERQMNALSRNRALAHALWRGATVAAPYSARK